MTQTLLPTPHARWGSRPVRLVLYPAHRTILVLDANGNNELGRHLYVQHVARTVGGISIDGNDYDVKLAMTSSADVDRFVNAANGRGVATDTPHERPDATPMIVAVPAAARAATGSTAARMTVPQRPGRGLQIAALVLGLVAYLGAEPTFFVLAVLCGLLALILGLVGVSQAKKVRGAPLGVGRAGWIIGLIGILVSIGSVARVVSDDLACETGDRAACERVLDR